MHLANDAGALDEKASWGGISSGTYMDLGVVGSGDDSDIGLLKPMPFDQYPVCVAR